MADAQSELQLIITAQNKATSELSKLSKDFQTFKNQQETTKKTSKGLSIELAQLAGAYLFVKKGIMDSLKAWEEQEAVIKQTEAVLNSTNFAIGMSAKEIGDLASEMQNVTPFADEVVQRGENLLLTFTKIGKDIFPQATETMLDMSQALGQDVKNSAIQLGKALQDPERGVTALRKVGVNFNDQQMEVIKTLTKSGKQMEAQKMILKELSAEFGGSARKALESYGGRMKWLKNQIGDVQEEIGKALVNSMIVMARGANINANNTVNSFNKIKSFIARWLPALILGVKAVFQYVGTAIAFVVQAVIGLEKVIAGMVNDGIQAIGNLGGAFMNLGNTVKQALSGDIMGAVSSVSSQLGQGLNNTTNAVSEQQATFSGLWEQFSSIGTTTLDQYSTTQALASQGASDFAGNMADMGDAGSNAGGAIADKMKEAAKRIADLKKEMKQAISDAKKEIKDFKEQFKKDEQGYSNQLGDDIAQAYVEKQQEKAELEKELNKETTEDGKKSIKAKLSDIYAFFAKHKQDEQTYKAQIAEANKKAGMDSIELLKYQYEQEKAEREKDYKDQLKELKAHLKSVKKEYKQKLKELKKELKEEGLDAITIDVKMKGGGSSSNKKKRATGGSVMAGQDYIVGEEGMEVFRPAVSGTIEKPSAFTGRQTVQVNFDFRGAFVQDVDSFMREVESRLSRVQELNRLGVR